MCENLTRKGKVWRSCSSIERFSADMSVIAFQTWDSIPPLSKIVADFLMLVKLYKDLVASLWNHTSEVCYYA
jgi:hypothetical protein